jgi:hypothetical protein
MRRIRSFTCALGFLALAAGSTSAQAPTPAELDAAVVERADGIEQQRSDLRALLQRPEVRAVAGANGFDLKQIDDGVGALSGPQLQLVAPYAQSAAHALAGGQTLVIGATTLIIILLLIILIVLIA